jgi:ribosome biogenesis protein NSA1
MPRFSTVAPSGCRPVRVISGDELGYVKVIESRGQNAGQPEVVARWGDGGRGKGVDWMQVS